MQHRKGVHPSWTVSRVLSRMVIYLGRTLPYASCSLTREDSDGPPAESMQARFWPLLFSLAPGGVCLAGGSPRRWWALTPPLHPCGHPPSQADVFAVYISVALS